mmetsp:Transcript_77571/g.219374  ORF Transcript_77571/g.219374 Transcript_77571/m.219374 type:complete len:99 (-) Transcript_77571:87-383(-)
MDGEVGRFELWSAAEVERELRHGDRFRPSQRLVFADFLIRHGHIHPDSEPDYHEILCALHQPHVTLYPTRPPHLPLPLWCSEMEGVDAPEPNTKRHKA